jgi:hypothetical protein
VEQERLTVPGHLSSPPVLSGVRVAQSLFLCFVVCRSLFALLSFFISQMAIVLSGLLRFTYSDYPFDIFKLFYPRKTQIKIKKESERSSISFTSVYDLLWEFGTSYLSLGSCVLYITKNTDSKFYIGIYETKSALDKQKLIIQKTLVESKYL